MVYKPTFTSLGGPILQLADTAEGQGEAVAGAPLISTVQRGIHLPTPKHLKRLVLCGEGSTNEIRC